MSFDTQSIIQNQLDSGERLLWSGMPKQGVVFNVFDILMIPFSLFWGGFAIFWEIMVLSIAYQKVCAVTLVFSLFGIPFVLIGLYLIFGRFIYDSKKRSKTFYGLTNQRIIIVSGLFSKEVKSINLSSFSDISLTEKSDKTGTITFGQENQTMSMFGHSIFSIMAEENVSKFELIENAKDVCNQIRQQQKG